MGHHVIHIKPGDTQARGYRQHLFNWLDAIEQNEGRTLAR